MDEYQIKLAFAKVKQDINSLNQELAEIKELLRGLQDSLDTEKLHRLAEKSPLYPQKAGSADLTNMQTHPVNQTDTPTVRQEIGGLKSPNLAISTGNEGVPTDRQTDRQTGTPTDNFLYNLAPNPLPNLNNSSNLEMDLKEASDILNSLDSLKKEIRRKFKKLTPQEMTVFSTIYQLEDQAPNNLSYKTLAAKLNLSQSSIRDYVQKMIVKGIPIKKTKINNKSLLLSISSELKKIAPLSTIIRLREL